MAFRMIMIFINCPVLLKIVVVLRVSNAHPIAGKIVPGS
jgi:hypothetical protein